MLDQTPTQAAEVTSEGNNIDEGKLTSKQVYARIRELGKLEGKGSNSRPGLFLTMLQGAKAGVFSKDDVAPGFEDYARSVATSQGIGYAPQASEKQQKAKFGVAVRLGQLPHVDGMKLIEKVIGFQKEQRAANDGLLDFSPLDGYVKVARYQIKHSPSIMLADDVIKGLLIKPAPELAEEADILDRHRKAMELTHNSTKEGKAVGVESQKVLLNAMGLLQAQIDALGGTTADRAAAAKLEAETQELVTRAQVAQAKLATTRGVTLPSSDVIGPIETASEPLAA